MVPSSDIRIASERLVWKPFECAASPRIAWKATGLPVTVRVGPYGAYAQLGPAAAAVAPAADAEQTWKRIYDDLL